MLLLRIGHSAVGRGWPPSSFHQHVTRTMMMSFTSTCPTQCRYILSSRQKVLATVSRLFSQQISRLPLDAERLGSVIKNDVTVFTYTNRRFFLLISLFGGMQLLFWLNLASFTMSDPTPEILGKANAKLQKGYSSWMGKFYAENRRKIGVTFLIVGCSIFFYSVIYPMRSVSCLTLLRGGKRLGVTTYSYLGRTRYFAVPLDDVSCKRSRIASPTYVAMKLRGHRMYYLLDSRDGQFHQPELFDYVIGLNRSFT